MVMLVEDDAETRAFLSQILELEGFAVVAFANGKDALNHLVHEAPPCLVILDMRMPVMDGPTFRRAMQNDAALARIPVVVVTAFEPSTAVSLSPLRVFRKPLDIESLLGVVRENC
jgi:CheY-like chemotaxis protein